MSKERLLAKLFTTTGLITLIDIHKEELEEEEEQGGLTQDGTDSRRWWETQRHMTLK